MKAKQWILTTVALLAVAALAGCSMMDWSGGSLVTKSYDIGERFQNIRIDVDVDNIIFAPAADGACRVVCKELAKEAHTVAVRGDTLTISLPESKLSFGLRLAAAPLEMPEITVYLPESSYGKLSAETDTGSITLPAGFTFRSIELQADTGSVRCSASSAELLSVDTDTGSISLSGLTAGDVLLESDTGSITTEGLRCRSLACEADTGRLSLKDTVATGSIRLESDTGSIRLDGCDAETLSLKTVTGSVTGTLLTEKRFVTKTSTGSVQVPDTNAGGLCEITTGSGSIRIDIG